MYSPGRMTNCMCTRALGGTVNCCGDLLRRGTTGDLGGRVCIRVEGGVWV